jgi:hypothetical protein
MSDRYVIGFDPGGQNAFGWAVLACSDNQLTFIASGVCSNARDSLNGAAGKCPSDPIAVGIDAPLIWSESGDRQCDRFVRGAVLRKTAATGRRAGSTVSHVNSLRGACLVQGVLVAAFRQINGCLPESQKRIRRHFAGFFKSYHSHTVARMIWKKRIMSWMQ